MKADRKKLNDVVHSVFDYVQNSNIPKLNRCVFEATTARIIWASALNPTYILEALSRDVDLLSKLPMPVRYDSYKNIELLFKFSVEQQSALQEVCKIITENMVSESPTIDELKAVFK